MRLYLGWNVSSLTMHCFFSGTCFHTLGSAKSTRALAFSRPKPKRLLTISPAPFLFQPGLLASGSNSDVHTTKCCRSLQVRSGLKPYRQIRFHLVWGLKNWFYSWSILQTTSSAFSIDLIRKGLNCISVMTGWLRCHCLWLIRDIKCTYFCSKARANIPAASGAEADVPVCVSVHSLCKSALVCSRRER